MEQNIIYLNNAATSYPKPDVVVNTVVEYIKGIPFHSSRSGFDDSQKDVVLSCREKIAQLFNIDDPNDISFTSGSTESLNLVISGIELDKSHVITTAIEHHSVLRPLKRLENNNSIELTIVDCDEYGYVDPQEIENALKVNTKAIIVNHCSNVLGSVLDIKQIAGIAHKNNAVIIVDASQSAGCIPIDVKDMGIDVLAFTGHKSLFGLPGTGGIYIKKGLNIKPLKVGGTGVKSDLLYQPDDRPTYYEAGTQNISGIVSLEAGVSYVLNTGLEIIKQKKGEIFYQIMNYLENNPEIIIYGTKTLKNKEPLICFNIKGMPCEDAGYILENSFGIILRSGLHCAPLIHKRIGSYPKGALRLSPSCFNTKDEVEKLIKAIDQICRIK